MLQANSSRVALAKVQVSFGALARLDQHAVGVVVLHHPAMVHAGHAVAHLTMVHRRHAGRGEHPGLLHLQHLLLVLGMHRRVSQVELVQQLAFVLQHEADRLAGLDLDRPRLEVHVAEHHLDAAAGLRGLGRLAEGLAVGRRSLGAGTEKHAEDDQGSGKQAARKHTGNLHRVDVAYPVSLRLPAGCREHYIFVSLPPLRTAKAKIAQRHRRA